jgi:transposase-like protein
MAATRLSDEQKAAMVDRYREGALASELAADFGCSAATVTRVVKAALGAGEYEQLKQGRARGGRSQAVVGLIPQNPEAELDPAPAAEPAPASADPAPEPVSAATPPARPVDTREVPVAADGAPAGVLAIDDADDFGDDSDVDGDVDSDIDLDGDIEVDVEQFVALPVMAMPMAGELLECRPLEQAQLPSSAYMLVDKTVELEARPLREFPDLGTLPPEEEERRALMLFANPRKAKQLCGRSQRVIKLPDPWVLHRTARYLVAQGITRVVVEGSLYALPGS